MEEGFLIEINKAGYPIAGSLTDTGLRTFIRIFLNQPGFIDRVIADPAFAILPKSEGLFKDPLEKVHRSILSQVDAAVLAHPLIAGQKPRSSRPLRMDHRRRIQVGGFTPYIAGVLVASAILYLFKRDTVVTSHRLSTDDRRWVITYNFGTSVQFIIKFSVNPRSIMKYRWENDIYTKLHAKNDGSYNVENFYDWQEDIIKAGEPLVFRLTYKKKTYRHSENPEQLMEPAAWENLKTYGWLNTGALIGVYNSNHRPLSDLNIDGMGIENYTNALYLTIANLKNAFYIGGLLHGDFKNDNVLIDSKDGKYAQAALIYDLDFALIIPYPPVEHRDRKEVVQVVRDPASGIYHPSSVNYVYYNKPIPQKISIAFLHFFDIFFLAYTIHYYQSQYVNGLNHYFQTHFGRNSDFDIFLECFNNLSHFRNTYKDPAGVYDYLVYDTLHLINTAVIQPTNKKPFKVYPHRSATRSVIQDIFFVQKFIL
jgi:hypothetical protein